MDSLCVCAFVAMPRVMYLLQKVLSDCVWFWKARNGACFTRQPWEVALSGKEGRGDTVLTFLDNFVPDQLVSLHLSCIHISRRVAFTKHWKPECTWESLIVFDRFSPCSSRRFDLILGVCDIDSDVGVSGLQWKRPLLTTLHSWNKIDRFVLFLKHTHTQTHTHTHTHKPYFVRLDSILFTERSILHFP